MDHTLTEQRPDDCSKEPVMRLARPSSPRHQDVSCVLASVFGNLHSQDVLDDDTIINLETSRTHDPDFHDYYVQLLNQIRTERKERLEALQQVEEHMLSAYNLAQQHNLTLQQDNTQTALGIPESHASIGSYLDNDILSKFNLLTPASYLRPSPPSLSSPTVPDLPNFMGNTMVIEEHERARKIKLNRQAAPRQHHKIKRSTLSAGHLKVIAPVKAAWRDSMNPDVRIEEQKGLEKLQAKSNFLKAKRFDKAEEEEGEERIFCTVPSSILFDSYEIAKTYEQKLKIKNVSTTSRQLKLLPPRTKHFTISKNREMSKNGGAIAPGLSIDITVTFMPDSLGRFEDEIQILPQGGNLISVCLMGERPPPTLSLPDVLDCGYSLLHGTLKTQFRCTNTGGPGIFQLYPCGTVPEEFLFNDLPPPTFEFKDTCFIVTPTSFALQSGQEVVIDVEFRPDEVKRYTTQFTLAADNCTTRSFKLTAESQSCHVQVIAVSGGDSTVDYDIRRDCDKPITVKFDDQNPGTKEEKILILRNCVNVPLHYNWEICKELREENTESTDKVLLKADTISPFKISPDIGILDPCTETSFVVSCLPDKAGKYSNISRLWIDDVPTLSPSGVLLEKHDAVRVQLDHLTQPHNLALQPPALIVPGESVTGYVISKTVKVLNNSLSSANVTWSAPSNVTWSAPSNSLKFNIRPNSFTVGAGSHRTVEIDIESASVGDKETYVVCNIDNVEKPLKLFVKAKFRGPKVTIEAEYDDPVLDFGYIHYKDGCTVQRQFAIRNNDGVTAKWGVAEMEHCVDPEYKQSEFTFNLASGEIGPFEIKQLNVTFKPHYPRSVKSFIECSVENGVGSKVRVIAEVQEPNVVLQKSLIDLGVIYVNVPVKNVLVFESLNFADCRYTISQVEGKDKRFGDIQFEESNGKIYAGARQKLVFKFTGREPTVIDDFTVAFEIEGTTKKLALGIKAVVKGLTIIHETPSPELFGVSEKVEETDEPFLDFGEVEILKPVSRVLKIINNTAIPTHFHLEVGNYRGDNAVSPPTVPVFGAATVTQNLRPSSHLLTKTPLLLDPASKSKQQSDSDYWREQLKHDRGVCFIASPASGYLPGNGVTIVTVFASSDMWGSYSDFVVSKVGDLDEVRIPIKMAVVESPLSYKLSNNNKPTVRFGSYPINEAAVSRTVQISNQGPQHIRLDWKTYNIVPGDSTLIDFNMFIGDAFPNKTGNVQPSESEGDLIRTQITAHEGQISSGPFRFEPDQCVIPARGTAKVNLLFDPRYGVGQCGGNFSSYALAYQSLDAHVDNEYCTRLSGEQVHPLRIHMTGKVEVPELIVTAEEHGFTFKLMAGTINPHVNKHTKIHKIALLNSSKLHLQFTIAAPPPFTLVDNKSSYTLIPRQKLKISHGFNLSKNLLNNLIQSDKQHFYISKAQDGQYVESEDGEVEVDIEEKMLHRTHDVKDSDSGQINTIVQQVPEKRFHIHGNIELNYMNGHRQKIPVHARIILPTFYITPQAVHFGTCLVEQTAHLTVRLINPSNSPLRWDTSFYGTSDNGTFTISPDRGEFEMSDSVLINISYTAHTYQECRGVFTFRCMPGDRRLDLTVQGIGSHDEKMLRML